MTFLRRLPGGTRELTPEETLASMLESAGDDEDLREQVTAAWEAIYKSNRKEEGA